MLRIEAGNRGTAYGRPNKGAQLLLSLLLARVGFVVDALGGRKASELERLATALYFWKEEQIEEPHCTPCDS